MLSSCGSPTSIPRCGYRSTRRTRACRPCFRACAATADRGRSLLGLQLHAPGEAALVVDVEVDAFLNALTVHIRDRADDLGRCAHGDDVRRDLFALGHQSARTND